MNFKRSVPEKLPTQKSASGDPIVLHNIKQRDGEYRKTSYKGISGNVEMFNEHRSDRESRIRTRIQTLSHQRFPAKIPKNSGEMIRLHVFTFKDKKHPQIKKGRTALKPRDSPGGGVIGRISKKEEASAANIRRRKDKTPPPMTTPVEKRNAKSFANFTENTSQIAVRQKINSVVSTDLEISFPPLGNDEGAEGPLIIEAEVGGHQVHRMCIDGGSSFEILYEHCFNRLRPEIRTKMSSSQFADGFRVNKKAIRANNTFSEAGMPEHSTSSMVDFMV
ncbi:hypothetical protein Tco_0800593 [Tanacetum coccineum]|uniref:Reverse transcriptase domain-containing protein n=1 Tax=Tanacetum coccineum TaxID=301880 RepID=A0ABQ4ZXB3_9ASTR